MHMLKKTSGVTIIEILIMTVFITVLFLAVATVTSVSLKTAKVNEHKILATHFAEELREWIRGEKERDWTDFVSTKMGTWCFTNKTLSWESTSECGYDLDGLYKREADLSANLDQTQVTVQITVSWNEDNNAYAVPIKTVLSLYE